MPVQTADHVHQGVEENALKKTNPRQVTSLEGRHALPVTDHRLPATTVEFQGWARQNTPSSSQTTNKINKSRCNHIGQFSSWDRQVPAVTAAATVTPATYIAAVFVGSCHHHYSSY
jgi:hypothetical protein